MIYNRTKSTATTYGAGRLRCWLRDPLPSEKSTLLPALLLVTGNSSSRAATGLGVKFLANMASYTPLDVKETGVAGGTMSIFYMRSTSACLKVGMCASGYVTIRLLLIFFRKTPPWRSLSEASAAAEVRTRPVPSHDGDEPLELTLDWQGPFGCTFGHNLSISPTSRF
jgi:hypothetical protein